MRSFISASVALIAFAGLGCQSSPSPVSQATTSSQHALIVSGGNGGSTTVFLPSDDSADPVVLSLSGAPPGQAGVPDRTTGSAWSAATGLPPRYGHN